MQLKPFAIASLACFWGAAFLSEFQVRGNEASERQDNLNGGYYLLHHLCNDESQLPMLAAIKSTPPEIVIYVDRIAKMAKASAATLDGMHDRHPAIRFDKNPLPPFERDVRESISDEKQHQLVLGTSGAAFVHALLLSQIEASTYALNIAKVLADQEKDPKRIIALKHIQEQWKLIQDEGYRHLKES
jgi:hypothetical protein